MARTRRRRYRALVHPAVLCAVAALGVGCSTGGAAEEATTRPVAPTSSASPTSTPARVTSPTTSPLASSAATRSPAPAAKATVRSPAPAASSTSTAEHPPTGRPLPLGFPTGDARQVVTVIAPSTTSTQANLQTWRKVGGGWQKVGPPVGAWLGSQGLSRHPSESKSATPIGSFTLTQAFGHDPDPGTALPYTHTTPDDWWISQSGPLYNTRQRCASGCPFTRGDPNEHLYYETPYYDYAVVIDYNTRNAPGGVRQGAGSAFFLHVTVGEPTAGCVAIPRDQLVRILRWLEPSRHPRILIGLR